ncbi:MAG TPA: glycosyltransferase family 39 protein [Myxococcota bacterium]|nr:glycosyltransferase family 39 protein [Myxococcota bacterium]HQK50913.1 glycosyltransferase family 39 protein [Myxococcota bacterium]
MTRSRWLRGLPWLLVSVALCWNLSNGSLLSSDDAIYAQAAREALEAGRWLDVTWQRRPLFEKGPVLFWALEGAMALLGPSDLAARVPGVLAGLLLLMAVHRIGTRLGAREREAWVGAGLVLATNLFYLNARRPMTDVPGAMLALWGLAWFLEGSRRGVVGAGILLGLSLLTKVIAPFPVVVALLLLQADRRFRGPGRLAATLGIMLAVALPWHLAMMARHGDAFLSTYVGYHLLHRAAEAVVGPGPEVYAGWVVDREGPAGLLAGLVLAAMAVLAFRGQGLARLALALTAGGALPLLVARTALPHYLVALLPGIGLAATAVAMELRGSGSGKVGAPGGTPGRWIPWAAVATLGLSVFLWTNARDLQDPDYAPDSRDLCEAPPPGDRRLVATVDLHDPALVWYCQRPIRFLALDPRFHQATRGIPMLQGVVVPATPRVLREVAAKGGLLVTVPDRLPALARAAGAIGLRVQVQRERPRRVVLSLEAVAGAIPSRETPPLGDEEPNDPSEDRRP